MNFHNTSRYPPRPTSMVQVFNRQLSNQAIFLSRVQHEKCHKCYNNNMLQSFHCVSPISRTAVIPIPSPHSDDPRRRLLVVATILHRHSFHPRVRLATVAAFLTVLLVPRFFTIKAFGFVAAPPFHSGCCYSLLTSGKRHATLSISCSVFVCKRCSLAL